MGDGVHLLDYNFTLFHELVDVGMFQEMEVDGQDWEGLVDQTPFAASAKGMMQVGYHGDKC